MINILGLSTVELPVFNKAAIFLINFAIAALLLTVFNHNKFKDRTSKAFAGMAVTMAIWVNCAYLARLVGADNIRLSEILLRIAWLATPLLFYFTYLISILVIEKWDQYKKLNIGLLFVVLFFVFAAAFSDLIIEGVRFTGTSLDIVYGLGFIPFLVAIFGIMVMTLYPLFRTKLTKKAEVFLVGIIIFYVANLVFNIILPVFLDITYLYYIGDYSTIILLGFTTYAIVKHKLFDIKVVATEVLTVVIWMILFSKLVVAQSTTEAIVDAGVFLLMLIFGILLIRSIIKEVKQREKLEQITEQLRKANQQLEQIDEQKDEFISMAAHELRAPMTAIKGYISMLLEGDAGQLGDTVRGYLIDTLEGSDRMIRLVNNMLNVARIEEGRMVYSTGTVNMRNVAEEVAHEFKEEARHKNLQVLTDISKNLSDLVFVDKDRIYEVVGNLVSNGIKYTDTGTVTIKLSNPNPGWIRMEIKDTGIGIPENEQNKLFQKFERAESSVGKTIGTGLGLYISKLLVEEFGGQIGLTSEFGKGSNFWFDLPIKRHAKD